MGGMGGMGGMGMGRGMGGQMGGQQVNPYNNQQFGCAHNLCFATMVCVLGVCLLTLRCAGSTVGPNSRDGGRSQRDHMTAHRAPRQARSVAMVVQLQYI